MDNDQNGVMPTPAQADNSVSAPEGEPLQTSLSAEAAPFWAAAEAVAKELWYNDPARPFTDEAWERELYLLGKCGSEPDFVRDNLYASKCFRIAAAALKAADSQASLKSGATQAEPQAMDEHDTLKKQIEEAREIISLFSGIPIPEEIDTGWDCVNVTLLNCNIRRARSFLEEKKSFVSCHLPDSAERSVSAPSHEAAVERAHELNLSTHERKHEPNDLLCYAYA